MIQTDFGEFRESLTRSIATIAIPLNTQLGFKSFLKGKAYLFPKQLIMGEGFTNIENELGDGRGINVEKGDSWAESA